jgi:DNA-binding LytR/AlgR family response regulator
MEKLKILIVEDELITAADIQETLEKAGHQIIAVARDFKEAMAAVKHQLPDLAMIDIRLENSTMDGIGIAKELLNLHWIPIIYLTANSEIETFQRAKETLPAAYLLKPFRHRELVMQVELAYANQRNAGNSSDSEHLYLPINKGYEKIAQADVLYLLADGSYAKVFMLNEEFPLLVSMNLGHLAQYFTAPNFYRLTRSLVINLSHLGRVERNQLWLKNHQLPIQISDTHRAELMKQLKIVRTH